MASSLPPSVLDAQPPTPREPWWVSPGVTARLIPGQPRAQLVPSVTDLLEQFAHLPAHEARYWAWEMRHRMLSRKPIPPKVRTAVYERDGHRCVSCGVTEDLTLDHIIPWSLCGPDDESNLQTLCRSCNCRKGVS